MVEDSHSDDMLSEEEEKILKKIEDWMDHDVETMISGGCNVSCATLLSIFMEVLGGIAEGTLMERKRGIEKHRFEAFLRDWLPREYKILNNELYRKRSEGFYEIFRCDLVHAYFFGKLKIVNDPENPTSRCSPIDVPGIREANDGSGRLIIHVNDLAHDIKKARDRLFKEIREEDNLHRTNFRKVFSNF